MKLAATYSRICRLGDYGSVDQRTLRVLLVEDHADTRTVLEMFLKLLGHRCEVAADASAALLHAAQGGGGPFDALLTDVHMPGANGWELVRELGTRGHLPVLVISMSAGDLHDEMARSKAAGCHVHLLKPFPVEDLEAALALPPA